MGDTVLAWLSFFHDGIVDLARVNQAHLTAKILTNRLQSVVPALISDYQIGFVMGRSITDNFLLATELVYPYLFIIVTDLLHRMLVDPCGDEPLLHPLIDDLPCPVIQYADDTLVLVRAEKGQVRRLKQLCNSFATAAGLAINYHKSMFVPVHVAATSADALAGILGCPVATFPQSYLSLPLSDKKLPTSVLDAFAIRVECCIPS
ncbi:uncharacterized protein [Setaria viridis]|uniref:uncharacterized protein n=1 Tax=Setaria viridis TaxID=4556 RepID=UPI0014935D2B|nr:uncharacterized protein LOC117835821 [Setaria viridis]